MYKCYTTLIHIKSVCINPQSSLFSEENREEARRELQDALLACAETPLKEQGDPYPQEQENTSYRPQCEVIILMFTKHLQ